MGKWGKWDGGGSVGGISVIKWKFRSSRIHSILAEEGSKKIGLASSGSNGKLERLGGSAGT